jgi:hypothetical protein
MFLPLLIKRAFGPAAAPRVRIGGNQYAGPRIRIPLKVAACAGRSLERKSQVCAAA